MTLKAKAKRATEDQFDELHRILTTEFLARIRSGEATTAEWRKIVGGPFKTYDWDESLYQSDNTKGWIETGTVNNTPDDWEEPS